MCDVCLLVYAACNCVPANTINNSVDNCDKNSGQCRCKHTLLTSNATTTLGLRCERCIDGHYMHPVDGCVRCDNCPRDSVAGNSSCHWSKYHAARCTLGLSRL